MSRGDGRGELTVQYYGDLLSMTSREDVVEKSGFAGSEVAWEYDLLAGAFQLPIPSNLPCPSVLFRAAQSSSVTVKWDFPSRDGRFVSWSEVILDPARRSNIPYPEIRETIHSPVMIDIGTLVTWTSSISAFRLASASSTLPSLSTSMGGASSSSMLCRGIYGRCCNL